MTPPSSVLLVLAWDDADPAVHRVGAPAALPVSPTLPLVRALAAGQPVLALLPQQPAAGEVATPLLQPSGPASRLVGLSEFTPATLTNGLSHPEAALEDDDAPAAGGPGGFVQLRPSPAQRAAGWLVPAAPYAGQAESRTENSAASTANPEATATPETDNSLSLPASAVASGTAAPAPLFDQQENEIGTAEADGLDLAPVPAPTGPAQATLTQGLAALHRAPAAADEATPPAFGLSDDLHYRVIQYARFATYLSDTDTGDVGVIYAPDWPTWLAALEIRYRRRRPLVLHLHLLAAESAAPAERGWLLELERYALRRAHTVLVVSDALRAQVLKHYDLAPNRVRVVAADDADGVRAALAEIGSKNAGI